MKKVNVAIVISSILSLAATQAQAALYIPSNAPQGFVDGPVPKVDNIADLPLVQTYAVKKQARIDDIDSFSLEDLTNANVDGDSEGSDIITVSTSSVATTPDISVHSASVVPPSSFDSSLAGASVSTPRSVVSFGGGGSYQGGVVMIPIAIGATANGAEPGSFAPPPSAHIGAAGSGGKFGGGLRGGVGFGNNN